MGFLRLKRYQIVPGSDDTVMGTNDRLWEYYSVLSVILEEALLKHK